MIEFVKWEYMITRYPIDRNDRDLTQFKIDLECFGARGWELVQILAADNAAYRCVFKRPIGLGELGDWWHHPMAEYWEKSGVAE